MSARSWANRGRSRSRPGKSGSTTASPSPKSSEPWALKPHGRLVIVERDRDRSVHKQEATTRDDFITQMALAGFEVVSIDTSLSEDNIYVCLRNSDEEEA